MASSRIRELTRGLDRNLVTPGGLFRLVYGLRNPPVGRGLGLDGVETEDLIHLYARALDLVHDRFRGWGWPTPRRRAEGTIPVYVFRTERLGYGDCPLTFTGEVAPRVYASRITLRSCFDQPRPEIRRELAEVEAAHEAAHVFTHQYVPPIAAVGNLWRWFDEATAVFMESEIYPGHPESRKFGVYWNQCPEVPLTTWGETTWGGFGGYFAAWFVRFLVKEHGPGLLLEVWRGADGRSAPLDVLGRVLGKNGQDLADVFWEYAQRSYVPEEVAPGLAESFGRRSVTETFVGPTARGRPDPLFPLACRYYRVNWEGNEHSLTFEVSSEGELDPSELRGALLTVGSDGQVTNRSPMLAESDSESDLPSTSRLTASGTRPGPGGHTAIVVARVHPSRSLSPPTPALVSVGVGPDVAERPEPSLVHPSQESGFDNPSARQSAFLGPRFATVQPREEEEDDDGASASESTTPELPPNFRGKTISEYRRRRRPDA